MNHKHVVSLAGFLIALGSPNLQAQDKTIEDVTYFHQDKTNWCWAATAEMILSHFGTHVSQQDIWLKARTDMLNSYKKRWGPNANIDNVAWLPPLRKYGLTTKRKAQQLPKPLPGDRPNLVECEQFCSWEWIKAQIDAGQPIAALWGHHGGGAHWVTVCGYENILGERIVVVFDPWTANSKSTFIAYDFFVHDHQRYLKALFYDIKRSSQN